MKKNQQYILGIDLALTSSAFSILDYQSHLIDFFYTTKKITKNDIPHKHFLLRLEHPNHYINELERINQYIQFIVEIFQKYPEINLIVIEGLSNNSISNRKNETSGLFFSLLRLFYNNKKSVLVVPPKTMKKIIADNGGASKTDIIESIENKFNIKLEEIIKNKLTKKKLSDIYDSIGFSIVGLLFKNSKNHNNFLKINKIVLI